MKWVFLAIAILGETVATLALRYSNGFKNIIPVIIIAIGYGVSFYFQSLAVKQIPVGITYAIWSGAGIILVTTFAYFAFKQKVDIPTFIGLSLIVIGIVVINLFSKNNL
jgi:small multidrug resistance pump